MTKGGIQFIPGVTGYQTDLVILAKSGIASQVKHDRDHPYEADYTEDLLMIGEKDSHKAMAYKGKRTG
jgi:hypothetical protein